MQNSRACSRLQPKYKTSPRFLKQLNHASRPIQDMLINQDDQDDDETSSKRSRGKWHRATVLPSYKFNLYLPGVSTHTLSPAKPIVQKHSNNENFLFSRTSISIAICCLRI